MTLATFTEETGSGANDTITLGGAIAGMLPFNKSIADGALFRYVIEDSGGSIKVAGIGTLTHGSPDTFTRNDFWNYDGTNVNANPVSNIALGGGTHKVRAGVAGSSLINRIINKTAKNNYKAHYTPDNVIQQDATTGFTANRLVIRPALFLAPTLIEEWFLDVSTGDAATTHLRRGIWAQALDGGIGRLLHDSGDLSSIAATAGAKYSAFSTPLALDAGLYFFGFVTDSTVLRVRTPNYNSILNFNGSTIDASSNGRGTGIYENGITGALPSNVNYTNTAPGAGVPLGFR